LKEDSSLDSYSETLKPVSIDEYFKIMNEKDELSKEQKNSYKSSIELE